MFNIHTIFQPLANRTALLVGATLLTALPFLAVTPTHANEPTDVDFDYSIAMDGSEISVSVTADIQAQIPAFEMPIIDHLPISVDGNSITVDVDDDTVITCQLDDDAQMITCQGDDGHITRTVTVSYAGNLDRWGTLFGHFFELGPPLMWQ